MEMQRLDCEMRHWNRGSFVKGKCVWNGVKKIRKIKRACGAVISFIKRLISYYKVTKQLNAALKKRM